MHPSPEELSGYALGTIGQDVAQAVSKHVESCAECERTLQQFDGACDTFIEKLRQPVPTNPYEHEPG